MIKLRKYDILIHTKKCDLGIAISVVCIKVKLSSTYILYTQIIFGNTSDNDQR